MPEDVPTPSKAVYIFVEFIALGCVLTGIDELVKQVYSLGFGCIIAGAVFLSVGIIGIRKAQRAARFTNAADSLTAKAADSLKSGINVSDQQEVVTLSRQVAEKYIPRSLTPRQQEILLDGLTLIRGGRITIMAIFPDGEGYAYATDFAEIFRHAGWDVINSVSGIGMGFGETPPPDGLCFLLKSGNEVPSYLEDTMNVIRQSGLNIIRSINPTRNPKPDILMLSVGRKVEAKKLPWGMV